MFVTLRSTGRRHRVAILLIGGLLPAACGCSLIPSWDDIHSVTKTVKDTVTGKAAHDRRTQAFAEARILERRKDYAAAEKLYRELLTEKPRNRDCHHRLAVIASVQGKYDEAMTLYRQALDCGEPTADLWSDLGYCHYLQQQLPEAEGALRNALAQAPQHRAAMNNLALVVGEQGRLDESYHLFRKANSEAEAEANFAYLLAQAGEYAQAQEHYSRALSVDPEMRPAIDGLLQVTQRLQQIQNAQVAQQQGQQQPPGGAPPQGVQQVSFEAPNGAQPNGAPPPRPLIEVFTGGPRRPSSSAVVALAESQAVGNTTPETRRYTPTAPGQPMPGQPMTGQPMTGQPMPGQPTPGGAPTAGGPPGAPAPGAPAPWGAVGPGVQPFSFPQQAQPSYLQPSMQQQSGQGQSANQAQGPSTGGNFLPMLNNSRQ